jgi:hypothetical protein
MTTFTPGPWHEHSHRQIGPARGVVCEVWSAIGDTPDDAIAQADANCHLIAAAPALYAAAGLAAAVLAKGRWIKGSTDPESVALYALLSALDVANGRAAS